MNSSATHPPRRAGFQPAQPRTPTFHPAQSRRAGFQPAHPASAKASANQPQSPCGCAARVKSLLVLAILSCLCLTAFAQRKITPVNTPATATQPVNEFKNDTARINKRMRESMAHYHDENGNIVYIDTVTGREWRDSTAMLRKVPMKYPLWQGAAVAVDLWNPLMRAFGQHYGLIDFAAQLNLHNRYLPVVEAGLGLASNTPPDNNFTYKTPLSGYLRLGCDYNFLYNSDPQYQFVAGLRYGISPFKYSITDIVIDPPYWDDPAHPEIPQQKATVGWMEVVFGLRVNLWKNISAGWTLRYHSILHQSAGRYGKPWYIPGYGTSNQSITGSFSFFYSFDVPGHRKPKIDISLPDIPDQGGQASSLRDQDNPSPSDDPPATHKIYPSNQPH